MGLWMQSKGQLMAGKTELAAGDTLLLDVRVDETKSEKYRRLVSPDGFSALVPTASLPAAWRRPGVSLKVQVSR